MSEQHRESSRGAAEPVLKEKLAGLRSKKVPEAICLRLEELIREAAPPVLARLAPPRLALQWGLPEQEVLEAFLLGTRAGLFDLEWDLRCPSCTGSTEKARHLDVLQAEGSCEMCDVDFRGSFDESVEVTWRVHPSVRFLGELSPLEVFGAYAQPQPVRAMQLGPRATEEGVLLLEPGNYHILKHDFSAVKGMRVDAEHGVDLARLELVVDERGIDRGPWSRRPGEHALRLVNSTDDDLELVIARVTDQPWVSAARLAAHQGFRDLFGTELIGPDESFSIRHTAFVFTDILGSTELYERVGDSAAYALVRDHFRIMVDQVREKGGAIVKTIGDAIMATFIGPAEAFAFARDTLSAFDTFNRGDIARDDVIIKVGLHCGPCIAVTLNERLDYFGRTVNLAARVQGLSEGRDLVLSQDMTQQAEVARLIDETAWERTPFEATLKGIAGGYPVVRLRPPPQ